MRLLISLLVTIFNMMRLGSAFNIDTQSLVVQQGPRDSCGDGDCMFGFSVAQHKEGGIPWLLVGAPEADARQPGVHKGGAVYKCSATNPGDCNIIPFDMKGSEMTRTGQPYDSKSGQWLGSIVTSSGADGTVLACAPRYVWFSRNLKRREPIGTCYTAKNNFADIFEYSPCKTRKWGYHRQGSCQAGLGAAIADNGEQLFIGAVGSWYWQGQMYSINTRNTSSQRNRPGQVFSFNTRQLRNQVSTEEGSPADDDSYLGYSVATGEFNGDNDMDIAVGMPRGANLTGKVVLYNSNLTNLNNLTGDQIGAYFGYSIETCDLNGDGLDDILIGSPMWTDYAVMGKFETGRVYVVYQDKNNRFRKWDTLNGENHKARFGMSIASLGNINLDGMTAESPGGFQDFAVGAPYDGPDQRGAVYIFLGSRDGVMKKPSQVIFASDLNNLNLKTFGWSLSGGMDMDDNKYPDLLVGAYDSGHAVHMRSAPVVHMTASVNFDENSKQIDLEDLKCQLRDRSRVPCVQVSVSLQYTGIGVPNRMEFSLDYNLDAKKENQKRLFFIQEEGRSSRTRTITMLKDREFKETFKVYILGSKIHDKLTSLDIQMRYSLSSQALTSTTQGGLIPVLGHGDHLATDSLNIQKECGTDNICIPNLSIQTKEIESYLMGSGERLEIQTLINNSGEDAFNAILEVQLPRGVSYINANTTDPGISILCSPPTPMNNNTVQCEVGNPLRANRQVTTRVFVQPSSEGHEDPVSEFSFSILAKSSNPEEGSNDNDNWATYTVPIRVETDFRVTGKSNPAQVEYNISAPLPNRYDYEDEIGEAVDHIYDVKNKGPSSISEAEVYILWPSFNEYGDHLLYLLGFDYDRKKAFCEPIKNRNPLSVKLQGARDYSASAQIGENSASFSSSSSSSSSSFSSSSGISSGSSSGSSSSTYYKSSSSSQSSFGSSQGGGYGGRLDKFSDEEEESVSTVIRPISTSSGSRTNVEKTRYQSPIVADGAEETRLYDTQGQFSGSSAGSKVVKKSESSGSSSRSSSSSSSSGSTYTSTGVSSGSSNLDSDSGSSGSRISSGWRLLENGTYIRVYDQFGANGAGSTNSGRIGAGSSGAGVSQSINRGSGSSFNSQSSSSQEVKLTGSSSGGINIVSNSEDLSGNALENGDQGSHNTGWIRQPDGTYIRKQSSWSSWSSSSGGYDGQGSGGAYSGQQGSVSGSSSYSDSTANRHSSIGVVGGQYSNSGSQRGSSGIASETGYNSESYFGSNSNRDKALGSNRGYSGSSSSFSSSSNRAETTSLGGSQGSGNLNVVMGAAGGPGDYHGTMYKSELEKNAGGPIFSAGRGTETERQVQTTQYQGSRYNTGRNSGRYGGEAFNAGETYESGSGGFSGTDSESSSGQYGAGSSGRYGGSSSGQYGVSSSGQYGTSSTGQYGGSSSGQYGGSSSGQYGGSSSASGGSSVQSSSGSYSSSSSQNSESISSGSSQGGEVSSDDVVVTNGGKWVWSVANDKWEWEAAPTVASENSGNMVDSGSSDSGWVQHANGTWTRKTSSWSSSSQSGVRHGSGEAGSVGTGTVLSGDDVASYISSGQFVPAGGHGNEHGDHGTNSTGWVEMSDGTLVKKSSSWASWSGSSYDRDNAGNSLNHIQQQLENKVRNSLDRNMPANVEPGFEDEYRRRHRSVKNRPKRSLAEFQSELDSCESGRCTIIKCTIGPLEKDESVLFKVRSRLFTETQVKNYAEKVKISSKLVTRVTKLPFLVDEKHLAFQSHSVTTTVIPSEPGEAGIPWWVWLLAALGGILLLALITYCLYKCGFFKRRRPEDGPETEPLNGKSNGY